MMYKPGREPLDEKSMACPYCGKRLRWVEEPQIPGFRIQDTLVCPHCGETITTSMDVEFVSIEKDGE